MIILDTNVVSAVMQREPDPTVVAWLDLQPLESLWTTTITVFEVRFGIELLAAGRHRQQLEEAFALALEEDFERRILPFDQTAAHEAAVVAARRRKTGQPVEFRDTLIAGIATACRAALATRNTRHYQDLSITIVNPWTD